MDSRQFDLATRLSDQETGQELPNVEAGETEEYDVLSHLSGLRLYPDPELFVSTLEKSGRADLNSRVFVRCLQAYQDSSTHEMDNPE
jgi:hypothetical protein